MLLPALGALIAAGLILSRRPDVLLHPQLWAEDGRIDFQNAYNLGLARSIILPQAGYFETFPVLAAWIARHFPLTDVPFVMSLIGIAVQTVPAALLLSRRAETISPDIRIRALLALATVVLPNEFELDGTTINAQWFLAMAALIVILLAPPRHARWRALDAIILLVCGLNGPFAIPLVAVAAFRYWRRGRDVVPTWQVGLLVACAVIQAFALLYLSHHDAGNPAVEARPHPTLGATPNLFAALVGGRLFLGLIIGEGAGLQAGHIVQWLALVGGLACIAGAVRRGPQELIIALAVGAAILGGALLNPSAPSPAWPIIALVPPNGQRYYLLAQLAWFGLLVWAMSGATARPLRWAAAVAVAASLAVAIIGHWSLPAAPPSTFARQVARFDRVPKGTSFTFKIEPSSWVMVLTKR